MTRHKRGKSLQQWEASDRHLIESRLKFGLELLPWMRSWLQKRKLKIEGKGKTREIVEETEEELDQVG